MIGAAILIEAAGLGGPVPAGDPAPGLLAAGIGSLVFIGMGSWTGLSTSAWALSPLPLPPFSGPRPGRLRLDDRARPRDPTVVLAILELARLVKRLVAPRPFVLTTAAGLAVGALAIAFHQLDRPVGRRGAVLRPGGIRLALQGRADRRPVDALAPAPLQGPRLERLARQLSRRPTFPALFLGAVGGPIAAHLPGFAETQAVAGDGRSRPCRC